MAGDERDGLSIEAAFYTSAFWVSGGWLKDYCTLGVYWSLGLL